MILRALKFVFALMLLSMADVCYGETCSISVAVDLDKKITTNGHSLEKIKKQVNGLIAIYKDEICIYFVGGNFIKKAFIQMNFHVNKTQVRFIDGKQDKN